MVVTTTTTKAMTLSLRVDKAKEVAVSEEETDTVEDKMNMVNDRADMAVEEETHMDSSRAGTVDSKVEDMIHNKVEVVTEEKRDDTKEEKAVTKAERSEERSDMRADNTAKKVVGASAMEVRVKARATEVVEIVDTVEDSRGVSEVSEGTKAGAMEASNKAATAADNRAATEVEMTVIHRRTIRLAVLHNMRAATDPKTQTCFRTPWVS